MLSFWVIICARNADLKLTSSLQLEGKFSLLFPFNATMSIPTSAYVDESAVINAPLAEVWSYIKIARFSEFYPGCVSSTRCVLPPALICHPLPPLAGFGAIPSISHASSIESVLPDRISFPIPCYRLTEHGIDDEAIIYELKFQDGSVLTVKEEAKSLIDHSISWSIITAEPKMSYSSVLSTISLKKVTASGSTFAQFAGAFSSDAGTSRIARSVPSLTSSC